MNSAFRNISLLGSNDIAAIESMYNIHVHFFHLFFCRNQGRGQEFNGKGSKLKISHNIHYTFLWDVFHKQNISCEINTFWCFWNLLWITSMYKWEWKYIWLKLQNGNLQINLTRISLNSKFTQFKVWKSYLTLSTEGPHILKQTCSWKLQVCLSSCGLLVDTRH